VWKRGYRAEDFVDMPIEHIHEYFEKGVQSSEISLKLLLLAETSILSSHRIFLLNLFLP
jgi:hypothetical protein